LQTGGFLIFEDKDIENALKISETDFNHEMKSLHKNFVRTGNVLTFKGLTIKEEKEFWGDRLEPIRKSDIAKNSESILRELNNAKGKVRTFGEPIKQTQKLAEEIKNFDFSCLFNGMMQMLPFCIMNQEHGKADSKDMSLSVNSSFSDVPDASMFYSTPCNKNGDTTSKGYAPIQCYSVLDPKGNMTTGIDKLK